MERVTENLFIREGKIERVVVHVYNNKLSAENQKAFIKRVYSTLTEDKFDSRTMNTGYPFLLRQIMQHGLDVDVINEIIDNVETHADYTDLVTKRSYLHDFFFACINLQNVDAAVVERIFSLSQQGIVPEIPVLQSEEKDKYARSCQKIIRRAVKIIGIVFFE